MNITEGIRARRSIRKYKEGIEIPQEHMELMLEAAMMAPSAGNTRPWEFIVIENRDMMLRLTEIHEYAQMLKSASVAVLICGRPDLQSGKCTGFWPQDCGAATENLLLQALDLGYGACWCGMYPIENRVEAAQQLLGIESIPYALIALGVPVEEPKAKGFFDRERVTWLR